ncbi:hypothetical protein, partial [Acinetobacter pseudolwoffii]|uniref:hypothetical protein n=1 Tax=Acinetobacter pseudolwoffii TaxID=2053287 RepID=UPI00257738F9
NLFALMVVWGYPCESKSSPAHYSKHPQAKAWGCFFVCGIYSKIKYSKNNILSLLKVICCF